MTTHITLEDGRALGTSNRVFDAILESAAKELERGNDRVDGLREWLLNERCEVQGPGVGYIDLRELSPRVTSQFKAACISAYDALKVQNPPVPWLDQLSLLIRMWTSMEKGEPPQALTSPHLRITPSRGERRGPGW
jgi:hypothetical protein